MTDPFPVLAALAGPAREQTLTTVLRAIAQAVEAGAEVVPEPELRDARDRVARSGPLKLPRRADLAISVDGRTRTLRIDAPAERTGKLVTLMTEGGFVAEVAPFRWDAAALEVTVPASTPDWAPLRRWFLEWFQSRLGDVAPELLGVVHSLDGPHHVGADWSFTVDFGSAPVTCLPDLLAALIEAGAERMRLGQP